MANKGDEIRKIKELLVDKYIADDQASVQEVNTDCHGREFVMRRDVVGHTTLEYVIYRFDPNDVDLFPYFKNVKKLKKVCDYLIFAEDNKRLFVFIVELKKHSGSPRIQLEISECFVKFILERAQRIGMNINKDVEIRKIGLKDSGKIQKQKTTYYKDLQYESDGYILFQSKGALRLIYLMNLPISEKSSSD